MSAPAQAGSVVSLDDLISCASHRRQSATAGGPEYCWSSRREPKMLTQVHGDSPPERPRRPEGITTSQAQEEPCQPRRPINQDLPVLNLSKVGGPSMPLARKNSDSQDDVIHDALVVLEELTPAILSQQLEEDSSGPEENLKVQNRLIDKMASHEQWQEKYIAREEHAAKKMAEVALTFDTVSRRLLQRIELLESHLEQKTERIVDKVDEMMLAGGGGKTDRFARDGSKTVPDNFARDVAYALNSHLNEETAKSTPVDKDRLLKEETSSTFADDTPHSRVTSSAVPSFGNDAQKFAVDIATELRRFANDDSLDPGVKDIGKFTKDGLWEVVKPKGIQLEKGSLAAHDSLQQLCQLVDRLERTGHVAQDPAPVAQLDDALASPKAVVAAENNAKYQKVNTVNNKIGAKAAHQEEISTGRAFVINFNRWVNMRKMFDLLHTFIGYTAIATITLVSAGGDRQIYRSTAFLIGTLFIYKMHAENYLEEDIEDFVKRSDFQSDDTNERVQVNPNSLLKAFTYTRSWRHKFAAVVVMTLMGLLLLALWSLCFYVWHGPDITDELNDPLSAWFYLAHLIGTSRDGVGAEGGTMLLVFTIMFSLHCLYEYLWWRETKLIMPRQKDGRGWDPHAQAGAPPGWLLGLPSMWFTDEEAYSDLCFWVVRASEPEAAAGAKVGVFPEELATFAISNGNNADILTNTMRLAKLWDPASGPLSEKAKDPETHRFSDSLQAHEKPVPLDIELVFFDDRQRAYLTRRAVDNLEETLRVPPGDPRALG